MKVIATADLHYEMGDRGPGDAAGEGLSLQTRRLAREVLEAGPDAFVVAGDTFAHDVGILAECLGLFADLSCPKILVAGNHDLWTLDGDSMRVYEETIPACAAAHGFHYLDHGPLVVDDVGFAGNMGWYDYSFREEALGVPLRFYQAKTAPGAAWRMGRADLFEREDDLTPEMLRIGTIWRDGQMVRWQTDDVRFTDRLVRALERQIEQIEADVRAIVCVTHHLPFANMVTRKAQPGWAFGNAFMGSGRFGELLLRRPKVRFAVCGHSHVPARVRNGHVDCINVGSTYRKKRWVAFEV